GRVELPAQAAEEAAVPLLGRQVLPDGGEIQDGDPDALLAQPLGRADHQGGLPHLPRGEQIAELAAAQRLVQLPIRPALHIRRRVRAKGAAHRKEVTHGCVTYSRWRDRYVS